MDSPPPPSAAAAAWTSGAARARRRRRRRSRRRRRRRGRRHPRGRAAPRAPRGVGAASGEALGRLEDAIGTGRVGVGPRRHPGSPAAARGCGPALQSEDPQRSAMATTVRSLAVRSIPMRSSSLASGARNSTRNSRILGWVRTETAWSTSRSGRSCRLWMAAARSSASSPQASAYSAPSCSLGGTGMSPLAMASLASRGVLAQPLFEAGGDAELGVGDLRQHGADRGQARGSAGRAGS